jgi:hypothetical protein
VPWIIPSHQAPALLLKNWRPRWFSGLALVLGSLAPDLEFIVPLRKETFLSHTVIGQVLFTVPVVLLLYLLTTELVLPWLSRYLGHGWRDLEALQRPRGGVAWLRVAVSASAGGLTHLALDGFTHGPESGGSLVAWVPLLAFRIWLPLGSAPLHDVLHVMSTILFGVAALQMWQRIASERLLWTWSGEAARSFPAPEPPQRVLLWLTACGFLGAAVASALRAGAPLGPAIEFAAWGFLDGVAFGALLAATLDRIVKRLSRRGLGVIPRWVRD